MTDSKKLSTPARLILAAILVVAVVLVVSKLRQSPPPSDVSWGVLLPLTGDRGAYGAAMRDGIALAIDEINAGGGVDGRRIKLIIEDTKSAPRDCVSAFEKLASQDKVPVILGPMSSSEVLSVAPLAEQRHILLFTPSASSPAISDAGDYIFRNVPSDVFEGSAMAEVAADQLKLKSIGILYINTDYGIGVVQTFRAAYEKLGGKVVDAEAYPDGTRDFRTHLQKIKEANPEALYIVGYKEMGAAVAQTKELALPQRLLSTAIFEDPEILKAAGDAAEGLVFTSITFDPANPDPRAVAFTKNYRERFKREPDGYAASAYDAACILAQAARSAGSLEPDRMKDALYHMQDFKGLLGNVKFDAKGDAMLPIRLKRVSHGTFEAFKP
jgi:branched-chain amino acid transport system substrate-binding protein